MRRPLKVFVILVAVLIVVTGGGIITMQRIERKLEALIHLPVKKVDLTAVPDGTYQGSFSSFPVSAEVEVEVRGQRITDIIIVKHEHGQGSAAQALPEEVIKRQTLQVDSITGATYSSKVILKAIEDALTRSE